MKKLWIIIKCWFILFWRQKIKGEPPVKSGEFQKPRVGNAFNPFKKFPVNALCYCKSGKKYKFCCIDTEPDAIDADMAKEVSKLVKVVRKARKSELKDRTKKR